MNEHIHQAPANLGSCIRKEQDSCLLLVAVTPSPVSLNSLPLQVKSNGSCSPSEMPVDGCATPKLPPLGSYNVYVKMVGKLLAALPVQNGLGNSSMLIFWQQWWTYKINDSLYSYSHLFSEQHVYQIHTHP